jgi:hypothetical protein
MASFRKKIKSKAKSHRATYRVGTGRRIHDKKKRRYRYQFTVRRHISHAKRNPSTTDLILFGALGLGAYLLWQRSQASSGPRMTEHLGPATAPATPGLPGAVTTVVGTTVDAISGALKGLLGGLTGGTSTPAPSPAPTPAPTSGLGHLGSLG